MICSNNVKFNDIHHYNKILSLQNKYIIYKNIEFTEKNNTMYFKVLYIFNNF